MARLDRGFGDTVTMTQSMAHIVVSLFAVGLGLGFLSADRWSRTSQLLAVGMVSTGLSIFLNLVLLPQYETVPVWSGLFALPETVAIVALLEWMLRVRRTLPVEAHFDTRAGDYALRVGQLSGVIYGVISVIWYEERAQAFARIGGGWAPVDTLLFWGFMTPILVSMLSGLIAVSLLLNRRPDPVEAVRVTTMAAATPALAAGFALPLDISALAAAVGEIIFLVGAAHYYVMQGRRGQFMSRFLSPQVARLVAERGLDQAMQESLREITVVNCDLRGFTAYAAAQPPGQVLAVLRDYYECVGRIAAEHDATIKDYAGDGILMLLGAPLPVPYHAERGIELAKQIRAACEERLSTWIRPGSPLGIGIGIATGPVVVGVIGSMSRFEYTAVGSSVNLSSRLCEAARAGEILLDERTRELAEVSGLELRPPLRLKGYAEPVGHAAVGAAALPIPETVST